MAATQITITAEEKQYLVELLSLALKEMRIEEHRTRTPAYREHVLQQEALAESMLAKLKQAAG